MNSERKNARSSRVRLAIGVGLTLCLLAEARAQSLLTTNGNFFAWPETEVPGLPGVYFAGHVDFVTLAEDGTLAFRSDLHGAGTSGINERALFTGASAATLAMLARWNDPAPGLPDLSLISTAATPQGIHSTVSISPSGGYTLWSSPLSGPDVTSTNDSALFRSSPGGHSLIAREGDPAPGTAGAVYSGMKQAQGFEFRADYQFAKINRHGTVLFYSKLAGGDVVVNVNDYALFTGTPGALSILLRTGDMVLPGPVTATGLGFVMQLDNDGRVLHNLQLGGAGVTAANDMSLWLSTPGSGRTLLVREGNPAPGTTGATLGKTCPPTEPPTPPDTCWFVDLPPTALTRSGRYVLTSDLKGGDVTSGVNDSALYAGTVGGGLTLIARSGQSAPGTDAVFQGFSTFYSLINDAGDVAFQGVLTGGSSNPANNSGIWMWKSGTLSLVVRSGGPVPLVAPGLGTPGIAPGTTFGTFIGHNMAFNDFGQIVVDADLLGGDIIPGFDSNVLLAWDPTKGLFLAARSGEEIEGAPGSVRTSRVFGFVQFNNSDGVSLGLGKNGRVGLSVTLSEGSAYATLDLNCYPSTAFGVDSDGDGKGDPATRVDVCSGGTPPTGYVPNATDCNDGNVAVYNAYYLDADGDGYGDPGLSVCDDATPPAGYVVKRTDCDDTRPVVHPGASEVCDGLDNNCNLKIDEELNPYDTICGFGPCASTGHAECRGVQGWFDNCTPNPNNSSPETCNQIDDNCNGVIDDVALPSGTPSVTLSRIFAGSATLSWTTVVGATGYDVTRGSLVTLRSSQGDFTAATTGCLGNNLAATTVNDLQSPAVGQGFWYVLRAVNCGGNASYDDSGSPDQVGLRDAEIAASLLACQ